MTINWINVFCTTAVVALTVPGFVRAVRALPFVDAWVMRGIKPWACDICMCFWSTGLWVSGIALLLRDGHVMLACGPAYTAALVVLEYMQRPPEGSEPLMPPLAIEEPGLAEKLEGE